MFLQEHALYKLQFGWFEKLSNGIAKHGVSVMYDNKVLHGRPSGGAAILWNKNVKATFKPIDYESDQVCALAMYMNDRVLLLICVCIPCDDRRLNQNLVQYIHVLNDIEINCNMVDANYVCSRGDLNTDLMRGSYQTQELVKFVDNQSLCLCVNDLCSTVEYTL